MSVLIGQVSNYDKDETHLQLKSTCSARTTKHQNTAGQLAAEKEIEFFLAAFHFHDFHNECSQIDYEFCISSFHRRIPKDYSILLNDQLVSRKIDDIIRPVLRDDITEFLAKCKFLRTTDELLGDAIVNQLQSLMTREGINWWSIFVCLLFTYELIVALRQEIHGDLDPICRIVAKFLMNNAGNYVLSNGGWSNLCSGVTKSKFGAYSIFSSRPLQFVSNMVKRIGWTLGVFGATASVLGAVVVWRGKWY